MSSAPPIVPAAFSHHDVAGEPQDLRVGIEHGALAGRDLARGLDADVAGRVKALDVVDAGRRRSR